MSAKRWVRFASVLAMVVALTACGGGGSSVTQPSTPTPTPTPAPARALVRGEVVENEAPVAGATVSVVGANPPVSTTTGADGSFAIEAAVGTRGIRATAPNRWGAIVVIDVPAAGVSGATIEIESDSAIASTGTVLGRPISASNGMVAVAFENESGAGGESAAISAASDPAFTVSDDGDFVRGNAVLPSAPAVVVFTNVPPGTTGASVTGSPGRSSCSLRPGGNAAWPVEAKVLTYIYAACTR